MWYWVSSKQEHATITVGVLADENNIITYGPPITKKFIGQPIDNLIKWLGKSGEVNVEELGEEHMATPPEPDPRLIKYIRMK